MTITASTFDEARGSTAEVRTRAGRAVWAFTGSFLCVLGVLVVSVGLVNRAYTEALYNKAEELGVNQNHLPAEVLADLVRRYPDPVWSLSVYAGLFVLSAALFARGLLFLGAISGPKGTRVARVSAWLTVVGGVAMAVMTFLPRRLAAGDAWLAENWWIYMTLVGVFVITTALGLLLVAVVLRRTGLAGRTGLVVISLCALTIAAQLTVDAPPILAMLLGTGYAFNIRRAARSAA